MEDYSAMKPYLEKNNLHYIYLLPKLRKAHAGNNSSLRQDTPAEDISNSLDNLGFNVINARQMTATRTAPNGQP
jgi:hypothetical protein